MTSRTRTAFLAGAIGAGAAITGCELPPPVPPPTTTTPAEVGDAVSISLDSPRPTDVKASAAYNVWVSQAPEALLDNDPNTSPSADNPNVTWIDPAAEAFAASLRTHRDTPGASRAMSWTISLSPTVHLDNWNGVDRAIVTDCLRATGSVHETSGGAVVHGPVSGAWGMGVMYNKIGTAWVYAQTFQAPDACN